MEKFKNKVVLVVGGASGIGRATALAAVAQGAKVIVADLQIDAAQQVAADIQAQSGEAVAIAVDATSYNEVETLVQKSLSKYGAIHYLCNSVGFQTYGTVVSTDEKTWDKTLDVNLKSVYLVSKFAIPEIIKQGGGAVVNISSVQGLRCQANVSAYAASKGAVISLTRSMALDFARDNVRVNCICPGSVDTPLLRYGAAQHGELKEVLASWGEQHPVGRIGTPEEIAATVLFLFSDKAGFILGQSIVADGGLISRIL